MKASVNKTMTTAIHQLRCSWNQRPVRKPRRGEADVAPEVSDGAVDWFAQDVSGPEEEGFCVDMIGEAGIT